MLCLHSCAQEGRWWAMHGAERGHMMLRFGEYAAMRYCRHEAPL
jgi:hypothetical protein